MNSQATTFESSVNTIGELTARDTVIKGEINLISGRVELQDSVIEKSISFNDDGHGLPPKLILKNTTIHGDVKFRGGNGVVELDARSKIEGSLVGATVVNQQASASAQPKL